MIDKTKNIFQVHEAHLMKSGETVKTPMMPKLGIYMDVVHKGKSMYNFSLSGVTIATTTISANVCKALGAPEGVYTPVKFSENLSNFVYPIIDALGIDWVATDHGVSGVMWSLKKIDTSLLGLPPELGVPVTASCLGVVAHPNSHVGSVALNIGDHLGVIITFKEVHPSLLANDYEWAEMSMYFIDRRDLPQDKLLEVLDLEDYDTKLQSIAKIVANKQFKGEQDEVLKDWSIK